MSDIDEATRHLAAASDAMQVGDWPAVRFHMDVASRVVKLPTRVRREDYDVDVTWTTNEGKPRTELVRVLASSRVLAHDVAQVWARDSFELDNDVLLHSTILEEE